MCMTIRDKYIDPFTDFGFKHIFGTEKNKHFLISFLNDILELEHKIIDISYKNLEMPKFRKTEQELSTHLDYWLYYLNNLANSRKVPKILKKDPIIEAAFEVAEFLALGKDEQFSYQQDLKARWDNQACLDFATETGEAKGEAKGEARGKKIGEKNKAIEIAKSLLDILDTKTIALKTNLTLEEVENL